MGTVSLRQDFIDSINRQSEINDWEYQSKLELLFMLQLVFLVLMVITILVILWKYDIMNMAYILFLGLFLFGCLAALWYFRSAYTRNVRDKRFWNKRRFEGDGALPPVVSPADVSEEAKRRVAYAKAAIARGESCPAV